MKTFKLSILVLCSVLVFNSCSKDDDTSNDDTSNDKSSNELVGTWNLSEYDYSGTSSTTIQGSTTTIDYVGKALNINSTMTITENPNEAKASGSYDIELAYSFSGQEIEQIIPLDNFESVSTWSRNGDIITFVGELVSVSTPAGAPGNTMSTADYTITELTDTTLRLSTSVESEEIDQTTGVITSSSTLAELVLTR